MVEYSFITAELIESPGQEPFWGPGRVVIFENFEKAPCQTGLQFYRQPALYLI